MPIDFNLMVGGEAGQGIQTIGFVLGKTMSRGGYHVFADQDYESRIRGGHNFFRVRISDGEVTSHTEKLDILIALNKETVELHRDELKENGIIIADSSSLKTDLQDAGYLDVPLERLAVEVANNKIMSNTVAVGAVLGLTGYDFNVLEGVLRWQFSRYSTKVQEDNIKAARAGYDYSAQRKPQTFNTQLRTNGHRECMFVNGNEALSLGALAAGCKFYAAYPMTPTTPILEYMMDQSQKYDLAVVQPEDEISAINMAVGAGFTGVRSMTATSGSGFALMVEAIGLAGITETPVVIVLGQRPGPAVGLPTRTEQGELLFAIRTGTGEFPRVVLAPANPEDAFNLTARAFNIAEKYQTPVIILTDTHLSNCYTDVAKFDLSKVKIERGQLLSNEEAAKLTDYKRHQVTESGVSPRALPGQSRALVVTDSDEHDEEGHLTERADVRTEQVAKRLRKYNGIRQEIGEPRFREMHGARLTLIGWGSSCGAIEEASEMLKASGVPNNLLQITEIWPFPAGFVADAMRKTDNNVVIESNATGQLAYLIKAETGMDASARINRYDGRPISPQYILDELNKGVV